jgi:4-diphosphocytidyl-2-C-methyl-D-erythritol kinase
MAADMAVDLAVLATRAPAKINLTLCVHGRRPDGYHALESLVAFAGIADHLALAPGPRLTLTVMGPTAPEAGPDVDNLVLKATRALLERRPGLQVGAFHLIKRLPAAAGIGGGSADAAAALRLLARLNRIALDDPDLHAAARATGADVPVCLASRARVMAGIGERLGPPITLRLFAVLVNPRVAVPTADVFRQLGLAPGQVLAVVEGREPAHAIRSLAFGRDPALWNDLEAPALALAPVIGEALDGLRATPECRAARMSGSGATVFGLYPTPQAARRAARLLSTRHPDWWIKSTILR